MARNRWRIGNFESGTGGAQCPRLMWRLPHRHDRQRVAIRHEPAASTSTTDDMSPCGTAWESTRRVAVELLHACNEGGWG